MVDSSALIAIIRREPDAAQLTELIARSAPCVMSAVTLLEASMVAAGRGDPKLLPQLDQLIADIPVEVVPFDAAQAEAARLAFLRYGKGRHPAALNLGDCASYALAKSRGLPLLFKGEDFTRTDLARAA